ncbi:MAG: secretin N-terminal domain-containing protein [Burkholderiales bacterium]
MNAKTMSRRSCCLAIALLAACATNPGVNEGKRLLAEGRLEEGLAKLEQTSRENPNNAIARNTWITQRETIVGNYLREGDQLRLWGDYDGADAAYGRALRMDRSSNQAQAGLDANNRDRRLALQVRAGDEALVRGDIATAEKLARSVLAENATQRGARTLMKAVVERRGQADTDTPVLKAGLDRTISLEFREAPIRSVFEVIARESGINFAFDRDVRPDVRVTIFVRDSNLDDVIKLILATNQLTRKVMNENSILVYPNTPAKLREYQDVVMRSFYLSNADVKQTAAMIRALVKTRDLFIDEKLNLVVMKDTPEAVRLAEQLVAAQDLGEPEVMLEVEVLEVASSRIQEFGVRYPERINFGILGESTNTQTIGQGGVIVNTPVAGAAPPIAELRPRQYKSFVANPAFVLNLRQIDGSVNLLANPRIRVKNREKAKIHIGEKVPVITTTSTANVGVSSSVNYLEVGLKLDVEPNIYLEDDVGMKVQLEVSNILEQLNISGTISYRLGTRNTATSLRLRDGETQVLAGLINDEDRRAANKVPYIGDLPLLGKLFTSDNDQRGKTEIVLLITPHVVRNLVRPETVAAQFAAGTDASPGAAPLRIAATAPRSLALAPSGSGAAATGPAQRPLLPFGGPQAPARQAPPETVALSLSGPPQIGIGQEFSVAIGLPSVNQGVAASVEIQYDPAALQLVGGAAPQVAAPGGAPTAGAPPQVEGGRALIEVRGPTIAGAPPASTEVRFRVVAKSPQSTQIRIGDINAVNNTGQAVVVVAPVPHNLNIMQGQGAAR